MPNFSHTAVLAFGVIVPMFALGAVLLSRVDRVGRAMQRTDRRRARLSIALREHPGCTAFMRHYEAWQIMAAQGPTPMPTVAEVMSYGVMSQAEAEAYVAAWDPIVEWDQHRSRQHLADFAEMLLARAAIVEHERAS